mmetsp:Transcript_13595/g.28719  ORF Transcript_13595/g.28719 Transcript_13595/m.28719 type:complete len:81 (+) Transcript_13595:1494-1736(+)
MATSDTTSLHDSSSPWPRSGGGSMSNLFAPSATVATHEKELFSSPIIPNNENQDITIHSNSNSDTNNLSWKKCRYVFDML